MTDKCLTYWVLLENYQGTITIAEGYNVNGSNGLVFKSVSRCWFSIETSNSSNTSY